MSGAVAPWLDSLDEDWVEPTHEQQWSVLPPATHKASSLQNTQSRSPRRSLSGHRASLKRPLRPETTGQRLPLAALNSNESNSLRRTVGTTKFTSKRSLSDASDGSVLRYSTVERSKSASPIKKQGTLEWKRRLVNGQVGYGDQTDLFGPSGLENIFAKSKGAEEEKAPKNRMGRWIENSDMSIPSSPPPWPSGGVRIRSKDVGGETTAELAAVGEESEEARDWSEASAQQYDNRACFNSDQAHAEIDHSNSNYGTEETLQAKAPDNRTISGQSELQHEDFSPVYISKQATIDGQVNYAPLDSHLIKQFQTMHVKKEQRDEEPLMDRSELPEPSSFSDGPEDESIPAVPELSLPDNLPTGTPPALGLGRHVELKRGGYSQYGSFKQRPLSPWQSGGASLMALDDRTKRAESDDQLEQSDRLQPPVAPTPPPAPTTPINPREPIPAKIRSSGSPLKLFGNHDTFTNNRLLRRMSQLDPEEAQKAPVGSESEGNAGAGAAECTSSGNAFGQGELDDHDFEADLSFHTNPFLAPDNDEDDHSPGSEMLPPGSIQPFSFHVESSPPVKDTFKNKRKLSKHSMATSKASTFSEAVQVSKSRDGTTGRSSMQAQESNDNGQGKRPPTSPFKNPTPKRRRTLHFTEIEGTRAQFVQNSQHNVSTVATKPRPRTPTPRKQRQQDIEVEIREATEEFMAEPTRVEAVKERIESSCLFNGEQDLEQQAQQLAGELAAWTLRVRKPTPVDGERKKSITTQDFLADAMAVMDMIRNKKRPQSGLGSVEESDAEALGSSLGLAEDASALRLSRPPSREGAPSGWRPHSQAQTDARVISHLQKFAEKDDTEYMETTSQSLRVQEPEDNVTRSEIAMNEHANIRIRGPSHTHTRMRGNSDASETSQPSQGTTLKTQSSIQSNGESTGKTLGTSSTRKSDNVGTLAPDAVAHLIGQQVGGMTFDKETQRWVRVKSPKRKDVGLLEPPSNLTSDDDPFREISDLPIDETTEQRGTRTLSGKVVKPVELENTSVHDHEPSVMEDATKPETRTSSQETVVPRSSMRGHRTVQHAHSSSIPSRVTNLASSEQQHVETRATSWSDEEIARLADMGKQRQQPLAYAAAQAYMAQKNMRYDAEIEEEILFPSPPNHHIPTGLETVRSGKRTCHGQALKQEDLTNGVENDETEELDLADSDVEDLPSSSMHQTPPKPPSIYRGAARQVSLRRKTFTNRYTAEMHEQSELSFMAPLPGERMMSLSVSVSGPVAAAKQSGRITQVDSSPCKGDQTLYLSDLPDFTVHEQDEQQGHTEQALAQRLAQHAAADVGDRYALSVNELVKTLTDVEADEPYWEDIRQLDLHDRSLASLYGLDDFCLRVQDMDVSNNALSQLDGAPFSIRRLIVRSNQLSSLTAWGHLLNLQYLDVSDNQIDSLHGLGSLVHLRELCADDNQIESLDGIRELDGLLKLRLRRNSVKAVDFEGFQLHRLAELDLSDNAVSAVRNLQCLPALDSLILDENVRGCQLHTEQTMPKLTTLSMRGCGLEKLDVSPYPSLRTLKVDDNHLQSIDAVQRLEKLDTLSMRRQVIEEHTAISVLEQQLEARTILLSGNKLSSVILPHAYLNLQHLELASAGLQSLPDDFGVRMPNLRTLNLNSNRLQDIRPLLNVQRLEQLHLCGNRLARLRKSVATLAKMHSLTLLDLRDNPFTQGFYAQASRAAEGAGTRLVKRCRDPHTRSDDDADAELAEIAAYALPRGDAESDAAHLARLDEDTTLRRRVYELLLGHGCRRLAVLDGLRYAKGRVGVKDGVWERLVGLGIVRRAGGGGVQAGTTGGEGVMV